MKLLGLLIKGKSLQKIKHQYFYGKKIILQFLQYYLM